MTTRTRFAHGITAMVGGVATSLFVSPLTLNLWIGLGWRRPIQDWIVAHGAGIIAGYFSLFYIEIPDYTTAIIGGGIIGVVAWKRWWQLSLVYSGAMFALPYLSMTLDGSITFILNRNVRTVVTVILFNFPIIPLAIIGAWLTSKRGRRRDVRYQLGLCIKCGYDLTGNESGMCPECGSPLDTDNKGVSRTP